LEQTVNDTEILAYLESHALLERFYLFMPGPGDDVLLKYFDASGKSWNIMEDDDKAVAQVAEFLKRSGVQVFNDYSALLKFEQESGKRL
jgi:hypothetical protein